MNFSFLSFKWKWKTMRTWDFLLANSIFTKYVWYKTWTVAHLAIIQHVFLCVCFPWPWSAWAAPAGWLVKSSTDTLLCQSVLNSCAGSSAKWHGLVFSRIPYSKSYACIFLVNIYSKFKVLIVPIHNNAQGFKR